MKAKVLRLLKIRENETSKVLLFFLFALFIQSGTAIGETVANSMFLINIGVEKLPIIYMTTPFVILFFYIPIYSFYTKKYSEDSFFIYSLVILILTNIAMLFFIQNAEAFIEKSKFDYVYYFLLLYATISLITLYTLLWNFIDRFFDIIDSKRVFSIFSAGTALGAILGGISVSIMTQYFPASTLLSIWALYNFFALVVLLRINKKFKQIDDQEIEEESQPLYKQLFGMFKNLKSSTYVLVLSIVFFISILLATVLEYEYMHILSKDQSVESLAILFAELYIFANIFNLVVNFFLFNRMVIRFGVKNVLLIQPIAYLLVFSYLSIDIGIAAGFMGFFVVQGILVSVDYNNQNLLYNGINSKIKYQVRTFIENLGEPFAIALAGFLLFIVGDKLSIYEIAYVSFILALVYLFFAFVLKYQYPKAMIENLKDDWLDLSKDEKLILDELDLSEKEEVMVYIDDKESFVLVARFIYSYNAALAMKILLHFLNKCDKKHFNKAKALFNEIIESEDPEVNRTVIEWLDLNFYDLNLRLKKELGAQGLLSTKKLIDDLDDDNMSVRTIAAVSVLNSKYPEHFSKAIEIVDRLLNSLNTEEVLEGLFALAKTKHAQYAFYAAEFLDRDEEVIKLKALEAIYELSDNSANMLVNPLLKVFITGTKNERLLSLKILQKIQDTQSIIPLLKRASLLSAYEKRAILSLVEGMDLQSIPSLVTVITDKKFSYSARSIAARALGRLAFAQFKSLEHALILDEIKSVYKLLNFYQTVHRQYETTQDPDLFLMAKYFMDKHYIVLEFILESLSIGGNLPSFELIKTSLRSSNGKSRANAIETIEQSTHQEIFGLLLPLLDQRNINEVMYFYHTKFEYKSLGMIEILRLSLYTQTEIEVKIAMTLLHKYDEDYLMAFREKLQSYCSDPIKKALLSIIEDKQNPELIPSLNKLLRSKKMQEFTIFSLYLMLQQSELVDSKEGDCLNSDALYVLLNGQCQDSNNIYEKDDLIGISSLFIHHSIEDQVSSIGECELIRIHKEAVVDAIEVYPEIGLKFL